MTNVIIALSWVLRAMSTLLVIRAICSWFPQIKQNKLYEILFQLTEPILHPIRLLLNKLNIGKGMFDFSIIAAYLIIMLLQLLLGILL